MLVKKSPKNQIAIPKSLLEKAGISPEERYFDIDFQYGMLVLKPLIVEEKISQEQMERFEKWARHKHPGDISFPSAEKAIRYLEKKMTENKRRARKR